MLSVQRCNVHGLFSSNCDIAANIIQTVAYSIRVKHICNIRCLFNISSEIHATSDKISICFQQTQCYTCNRWRVPHAGTRPNRWNLPLLPYRCTLRAEGDITKHHHGLYLAIHIHCPPIFVPLRPSWLS